MLMTKCIQVIKLRQNFFKLYVRLKADMTRLEKKMEVPMVLEEVRDKGKHKKLLFKILIEEDSFLISIKCREHKEPVLIDISSVISPYVDKTTMVRIKEVCKSIYKKKREEAS